tara:strand:+ start:615 stop:1247 length:633 start_codon:yes stop_codon:yes gene_type:complete
MATRPNVDSAITSRLGQDHQELFFAVKAEFDSDDILVWTGIDDLTINSETYTGAGTLLTISDVEDTLDMKATGINIALSGMDKDVLDAALTENYQNRDISVFMGFLMGGSNEVAGVLKIFAGRMVSLEIEDTIDGATVNVSCENRLIDLERPSNLRYTAESQQFIDSNDTGLNRVQQLQDKQLAWGQKSDNRHTRGAGINPEDEGEMNIR